MSYILEALRKSERERSLGQVPHPARAQVTAPRSRRRRARSWGLWLALLANAALLTWLVLRPLLQDEGSATMAAAQLPRHSSALPHGIAVPRQAVVAQPERAAVGGRAAARSGSLSPSAPVSAAPPDGDSIAVPLWEALPEAVRRRVPRPELDVHFHTDRPARRFVLVDLKKYREGETLENGLVLEAITADGAVFSRDGLRFRVERP